MLPKHVLLAVLGALGAVEASVIRLESRSPALTRRQDNNNNNNNNNNNGDNNNNNNNNNDNNNNNNNNNNNGEQCLQQNAVQQASAATGQENGQNEEGQSPSATDNANFINFCAGDTLTNGEQQRQGSCNGIVMGRIPSVGNMITSIITNPQPGQNLNENETFDIQVNTQGLAAGSFTNPDVTYYSAPQDLDGGGRIIGHTHVTVQDLGNDLIPGSPPDPQQFVFFKGINDAGNGNGLLQATVDGGLPAGNYRVCTMTGASNHQPVLMPVAQRGAQDDCTKFTVGQAGNNNNNNNQGQDQNNNNNNNNQDQNNQNNQNQNNNGQDQNNNGQNNQGQDQNNQNQNNGQNNGQNGDNNNNSGFNGQNGNDNNANGQNDQNNNGGDQGGDQGGNQGANDQNQNGNNNQGNGGGAGGASAGTALGGIAAPQITESGGDRPFTVNGANFADRGAAVQRACDAQGNLCADAVNGGQLQGVTVGECGAQIQACVAELS